MKKFQKSVFYKIAALISCFLFLNGISVIEYSAQTNIQKLDGFYQIKGAATETMRAMYVNKEMISTGFLTTIYAGTNNGKVFSAQLNSNSMAQPNFTQASNTQTSVRDIYFAAPNKGYMLKNDGIYTSDFNNSRLNWNLFVKLEDLKQEDNASPKLYAMAFIPGTARVCVGGAYIVEGTDNQISKQLLLCTKDITKRKPVWDKPELPDDAEIQITSLNFSDSKNGSATGTEGTIWMTDDQGENWKKQEIKVKNVPVADAFMNVFGLGENKAWIVGYNNQIWSKSGAMFPTLIIKQPKEENNKDTFRVGEIVEIKKEIFGKEIQIAKKLEGRIIKINEKERKIRVQLITSLNGIFKNAVEDFLRKDLGFDDVIKIENTNGQEPTNDTGTIQNQNNNNPVSWNKVMPTALKPNKPVILRNIKFASSLEDERYGWIVGDAGTILYTEDGGETWAAVATPTLVSAAQKTQYLQTDFYSIFVDEQYCWIGGTKGTVVRIKYK